MDPVITIEKLKIYESYNGDEDAYASSGKESEKAVFVDDSTWHLISAMLEDIDMIGRKLASDRHTRQILEELKRTCDEESFAAITARLDFFQPFQTIAEILTAIKGKINNTTNVVETNYDNPRELTYEIARFVEDMQYCNFETLEKVSLHFLPTATFQELSISNGWPDEYVRLSAQFDNVYELIGTKAAREVPVNYELYKSFAEATEALVNLASGMTWNTFSNDYVYILSEIKENNKDDMERRKVMIAENKKKKPVPLEEMLPRLEKIYNNVYDFNLLIYKATKDRTVIDIRYFPKSALDPEHRKTVQDNEPMMHCKVPIPWWRANDKLQFDIHWEHHVVMPWWRRVWKRIK